MDVRSNNECAWQPRHLLDLNYTKPLPHLSIQTPVQLQILIRSTATQCTIVETLVLTRVHLDSVCNLGLGAALISSRRQSLKNQTETPCSEGHTQVSIQTNISISRDASKGALPIVILAGLRLLKKCYALTLRPWLSLSVTQPDHSSRSNYSRSTALPNGQDFVVGLYLRLWSCDLIGKTEH